MEVGSSAQRRLEVDLSAQSAAAGQDDGMELAAFQELMEVTYGERDRARGVEATIAWLAEELGELARAVRKESVEAQRHELGDLLAWVASLANQLEISLDDAVARYTEGCPKCGRTPCSCAS